MAIETHINRRLHNPRSDIPARCRKILPWALASLTASGAAVQAFEFDTGNPDLKLRWDNTLKYNLTVRTDDIDNKILRDGGAFAVLGDDADLGWEQGDIVNNRFDILSELDLSWKGKFGVRFSGAGWYDQAYSGDTAHPGYNDKLAEPVYADTWGALSVKPGELTDDAKDLHYRGGELLDAFAFANFTIGDDIGASVRGGRHTIYWGNSLFLAGAVHGIAGSMTTLDAAKGFSVPGTEAKELFRPTNKISGTLQLNPNLSLVGYYSLEFEEYQLPALGTYQSRAEGLTPDDEFVTLAPGLIDPATLELISPRSGFSKVSDQKADDTGEWGVGVNFYLEDSGWDLGLYYLNYSDKLPQGLNGAMDLGQFVSARAAAGGPVFKLLESQWPSFNDGNPANPQDVFTGGGYPAVGFGNYNWVYKEDVKLIGLSAANELWDISWGADFVYRMDAPVNTYLNGQLQHVGQIPDDLPESLSGLISATLAENGFSFDNWDLDAQSPTNYPGAVGDSWHLVLNGVKFLSPSRFWDGGAWSFETTLSQLDNVSENEELLAPRLEDKDVLGTIAANFNPQWFQVMPGLDVRMPINLSYTYMGEIAPIAFGGTKKFGNGAVGVRLDYQQKWRADLKYSFWFGPRKDGLSGNVGDRGNVSLTIKRTF